MTPTTAAGPNRPVSTVAIPKDISHHELGYAVSERIEQINDILGDIADLDIVDAHAAGEEIEAARSHLDAAIVDVREGEQQEAEGEAAFEDTPDFPEHGTVEWSVAVLEGSKGQSYAEASFLHHVAAPILVHALEEDLLERDWDTGDISIGTPIEEIAYPASEARSIVHVEDFEPIATYDDLTEMLVEVLGGEPSTSNMLGHGSTADVRHESNVGRLKDLLDLDGDETTEAEA